MVIILILLLLVLALCRALHHKTAVTDDNSYLVKFADDTVLLILLQKFKQDQADA